MTDRNEDFARAIRQRDVRAIVGMMFEHDTPSIRSGFRTEDELWDYKKNCPLIGNPHAGAWTELAKDVLGFHNQKGGVIVFGINDDFSFAGATQRLDSKLVNDQLRKYLGDKIWVEFHREFIQTDQRYVGLALVPPRGPILERFRADAPVTGGQKLFTAGDSALRERDSTRVLRRPEADRYARSLAIPTLGKVYEVDKPYYRVLNPDYTKFVERAEPCQEVERAMHDPRVAVSSIIGIGGVGKTALATWAVLRAYERKDHEFIVSVTAKDRELTSSGILGLTPGLTSFESLLDNILDVLGFPNFKATPIEEREREVRNIIEGINGLLFVDNLETVDDKRIISFLDNLPVGVRAVTTSRRASVRVSVRPIDLGPLTEDEVSHYISSLARQPGFTYASDLSGPERSRIGGACDRIPLAIKWALARSKTATEALAVAESITKSGRRGEELLEFCFRRIFDSMPGTEKAILQVLSLFQRPLTTEAIIVGANLPPHKLLDAAEQLVEEALVQRLFDPDLNDYTYTLLPITSSFVYSQVAREQDLERKIRQRLSDYFEARDVKDPSERLAVREVRQGRDTSDSSLVDLALAAERRGDLDTAKELYEQALRRNPGSWRAARHYAEFQRHKLNNRAEAIRFYEQAAANAPRRGSDRALIFREWGMLLKDSGQQEATDLAIEKFETARIETPHDPVTLYVLANMYARKGMYSRVIEILEPLADHQNIKTREKVLPILLNAYERMTEIVKAAETREKLRNLQS
jgi:tetratricopeptide (TPR) repeat protein